VDLLWFPWPDKATGTDCDATFRILGVLFFRCSSELIECGTCYDPYSMGLTTRFNLLTRRKTLGGLAG
jgi:hypothetical protein